MELRRHPVVLAGLLVGLLDILAAFGLNGAYGVSPLRVLQAIASGVLGPSAFTLGFASAALGVGLHLVIALGAAGVYYAASRHVSLLVDRAILCGALYGIAVHTVMDQIVLPLSRVNFREQPWHLVLGTMTVHVLFVGLPIALVVRHAARSSGPVTSPAFPEPA